MFGRARTFLNWYRATGSLQSVRAASQLLKSGRRGGEEKIATAIQVRKLPFPLYMRPQTDDVFVFNQLFIVGEYSLASEFTQPPVAWIVDLGTNVGLAIAYFSSLFPKAHFVGVEPSNANLNVARRSLRPLIDQGQVELIHAFIGATQREAAIGLGGMGGSNEFILTDQPASDTTATETLSVVTMKSIIDRLSIEQIDLLKCDIEGSENELFSNSADWIGKVKTIVVELHNGLSAEWLTSTLANNGGRFKIRSNQDSGGGMSLVWLTRD